MEIRRTSSPADIRLYTTDRLREDFLIQKLFLPGERKMVYSHNDRIIVGSCVPIAPMKIIAGEEIRTGFFLQRRELGIINIGSKGSVNVDGVTYELGHLDGLYVGMGSKEIIFNSESSEDPAQFYLNSAPAHQAYPTTYIKPEDCIRVELGTLEEANRRTITKYILPGQVESCQLVMGVTKLMPGSVWNTMPCHTHDRRMEVYLYFDIEEDALVFHYMGEPKETKHIVVRDREAVISPSWSIHAGSGTKAYSFIWGMAGENQDFNDMDPVAINELR